MEDYIQVLEDNLGKKVKVSNSTKTLEGVVKSVIGSSFVQMLVEGKLVTLRLDKALTVVPFKRIANPFEVIAYGNGVEDSQMVFGREALIDRITKALHSKQAKSFILWGQQRAGKSTILGQIQKRLEATDKAVIVIPVVDFTEISMNTEEVRVREQRRRRPLLETTEMAMERKKRLTPVWKIKRRLLIEIEKTLLKRKYAALAKALQENGIPLSKKDKDFPETLEEIKNRYEDFFDAYNSLEGRPPMVLLLDEFSVVYDWIKTGRLTVEFFKLWREELNANNITCIMVCQDYVQKMVDLDGNAFGTVEKCEVTYLSQADTEALIQVPVWRENDDQECYQLDKRVLDYIYKLSRGSAYYTVILCNHLVDYMNRTNTNTLKVDGAERAVEELIKSGELEEKHFWPLFKDGGVEPAEADSHHADCYKLCKVIATNTDNISEYCDQKTIIKACGSQYLMGKERVEELLDSLTQRYVLMKERNHYRIVVGLFKEWLKKSI